MSSNHLIIGGGILAVYFGYRFYSLQSDVPDGSASIVEDITSTIQTGVTLVQQDRQYIKRYFDCIDPNTGIDWTDAYVSAGRQYGVPPLLLAAQGKQESGFKANAYNSGSGCAGIAQFAVATAGDFGMTAQDRYNPAKAIPAQAAYMSALHRQFGTWPMALAAYNWGPGNLKRKGMSAAPAETRNYIAIIYTRNQSAIGA